MDEIPSRGPVTASHTFAVDVLGPSHQSMSLENLRRHPDRQKQNKKQKKKGLCFKQNTKAANHVVSLTLSSPECPQPDAHLLLGTESKLYRPIKLQFDRDLPILWNQQWIQTPNTHGDIMKHEAHLLPCQRIGHWGY